MSEISESSFSAANKKDLFVVSIVLSVGTALLALAMPDLGARLATGMTRWAFSGLDWFFLLSVSAFLVFCLVLACGRTGRIKLGPADAEPEFSTLSWLSMLFAAGMGTGLVVWGMAEPAFHTLKPPTEGASLAEAYSQALRITNFHWGLHAWAIYGVGGLILAYFGFGKGTPHLASAPIRAVFRGKWTGPVGTFSDLLAILAVAFGVAGSIAMGTLLVRSGLHAAFGTPLESTGIDAAILFVLFVCYTLSASTALSQGIRILSNINMALAILLLWSFVFLGASGTLLSSFGRTLVDYALFLPSMSIDVQPFGASDVWVQSWTLIYFVWWIAWAPFVGIFIARISLGRTIREFVVGVLVCPTVFSVLWFSVLGGVAMQVSASGIDLVPTLNDNIAGLMYLVLEHFPHGRLLGGVATVLVFVFLITSVDSATYVLGMLSSGGDTNPSVRRKLIWGVTLGALGAGFVAMDNIDVIKAFTVLGAIPFLGVMWLQVIALIREIWGSADTIDR